MPIVSPDSFRAALNHGNFAPLYFLFGDEEFLVEEELSSLLEKTVDESTKDFNFDLLHGSEVGVDDIVGRASAYPVMADRRVVLVHDIDKTIQARNKSETARRLVSYVENPAEGTILIMTAQTSSFLGKGKGKAKAPFNSIIERSTCVQFKKIYDRELPSWITARIESKGKKIAPDAVELFLSYAGSSLRVLNNEIEKLFTYIEERTSINVDDVKAVIGVSKSYNVFELQKVIGAGKLERSIEITERMLRAGEPVQLIITMLTRYFTILWRLIEIRSKVKDQREAARSLGISSFFINEYYAALRNYPLPRIHNAFEALLHADVTLKTSSLSASIVMHMTIISIISGENITPSTQFESVGLELH